MAHKQIVINWKTTQSECGLRKDTGPKSKNKSYIHTVMYLVANEIQSVIGRIN